MISPKCNPDLVLILIAAAFLGCSIDVSRIAPNSYRDGAAGIGSPLPEAPRSSPSSAPRSKDRPLFQMTPLRHPTWHWRKIAASWHAESMSPLNAVSS